MTSKKVHFKYPQTKKCIWVAPLTKLASFAGLPYTVHTYSIFENIVFLVITSFTPSDS